jgi:tetratricopeptide (TPR) repeat protein
MYYLAELAYSHGEYDRAASLYVQLEAIDPNRPELQTKRQKAFLIATDNFLRSAARAEADNRLSEAEGYYRQALNFAPDEPSLHARLADLLQKENKLEQAAVERKAYESLVPTRPGTTSRKEEAKNDSLDDIGRWSQEIGVFHQIRDAAALTREQFALLVVRYFPQVTEFRRSSQILIDVEDSPARSEIQNVVGIGLMDPLPNHYFVPAGPLTRSDLALALAHLTRLLGIPVPSPSITVADLSPSNGLYTDLQVVLSLGVMTLDDSGRFNLGGDVSGRDAIHAAEGLLHSFQQAQR